jgi:stage IV sporulation protein FB
MPDPANWSVRIASWKGVPVRVHAFLLVFVAATLCLSWQASADGWRLFALTVGGLVILVTSVLIHEFGHLLAARWLGLLPTSVLIGPFGGLGSYPSTTSARDNLYVAAAGPLANLAVCFVFLPLALIADPDFMRFGTDGEYGINPLESAWIVSGASFAVALKMVLWINGLLVLLNVLPAFPFDGGRIVRSTFGVLFPSIPRLRTVTITFWIAVVVSCLLAITAMVLGNNPTLLPFQTWLAPAFLAAVTMIGATHEFVAVRDAVVSSAPMATHQSASDPRFFQSADNSAELDSNGEPPFLFGPPDEDSSDTWSESPLTEALSDEESESDDERILDEILTKLHAHGRASLTERECEFLQRVSERYRQRS